MHLSLVCPRMGGSGNPGGLDFVKRTWVGILTSTMIPGVGNLTRPPSWKVDRIWEWVTSDAILEHTQNSFERVSRVKDGWTKKYLYFFFFTERDCNNLIGVILGFFFLWCTFLVPSLKITAPIFLEILLIQYFIVFVELFMTSSLSSFA